jgi:hypothetical protein
MAEMVKTPWGHAVPVTGPAQPPAAAPASAPTSPVSPAPAQPQPETMTLPTFGRDDVARVTLPDGRAAELRRPKVARQFAVYRILGQANVANAPYNLDLTVKALQYLATLDGRQVIPPDDLAQAQALMNDLGDDGVEVIANVYVDRFILRRAALPLSGSSPKTSSS